MMTYWFRPKQYGYGATPVTWQGWALTVAVMADGRPTRCMVPYFADGSPWASSLSRLMRRHRGLWIIGRRKTDGAWRWRWGKISRRAAG